MKRIFSTFLLMCLAALLQAAKPVIYIDPSFTGQSDGSQLRPFKSVTVIQNNTDYLQKCGTTYLGSYTMTNAVNVTFGSYGLGPRPIIKCAAGASVFRFNNGAADIIIKGLEITSENYAGGPLVNIRGAFNNGLIEDCEIHGGEYCIWNHPINRALWGTCLQILNNYIHDSKDDAIYIYQSLELTISGNTIYKANQKWYPGASNSVAPGDGVQLTLCAKITIEDNVIDRSDTGNKFCLIISGSAGSNGTPTVADNYIRINRNTFLLPKKTSGGGSGVYISDLPSGMVVDFTFNDVISPDTEMSGVTMRTRGVINSSGNLYLCSPGIGISPNSIGYYSSSDFFKDKLHAIQGGYELK